MPIHYYLIAYAVITAILLLFNYGANKWSSKLPEPSELNAIDRYRETAKLERIITEHEVKMHCVNTEGREFMCKNCGDTYDSLATIRHYCEKCGCWLCPKCSSSLCSECKKLETNNSKRNPDDIS